MMKNTISCRTMTAMTPAVYDRMNDLGARVRERLVAICDGLPLQVTGAGSLFKITATGKTIRNYRDAATADKGWEQTAALALLNEGYMLTTALSGCISAITTEAEIEGLLDAVRRVVR
jgi:glutamate-1-semialdehyde aminotransferase